MAQVVSEVCKNLANFAALESPCPKFPRPSLPRIWPHGFSLPGSTKEEEPKINPRRSTLRQYSGLVAWACYGAVGVLVMTESQRARWWRLFMLRNRYGCWVGSRGARARPIRRLRRVRRRDGAMQSGSSSSAAASASKAEAVVVAVGDERRRASSSTVPASPEAPRRSRRRRHTDWWEWEAPWQVDDGSRNEEMLNKTLNRVIWPTVVSSILGAVIYVPTAQVMVNVLDIGNTGEGPILTLLGMDQSQFMQNFLTVNGLLFTILVGNTYTSLYNQQERLYHALYLEVSEAKSLLEQTCLLCQGRSFYQQVMQNINDYVTKDLRRLDAEPSELLAGRPMDDPLESILYVTSVGVPSIIYDTVRDLRQARSQRLGAMQRKLPAVHFVLLYVLGLLELLAFPLLGAGTASMFREQGVLLIQALLFGAMCGAIVMTLQVCYELWQPFGGAYTVDSVLRRMVAGLEEELQARRAAGAAYVPSRQMAAAISSAESDLA